MVYGSFHEWAKLQIMFHHFFVIWRKHSRWDKEIEDCEHESGAEYLVQNNPWILENQVLLSLNVNTSREPSEITGQRVSKEHGIDVHSRNLKQVWCKKSSKSSGFDICSRACALTSRAIAWGSSSPLRRNASSPKSSSRKPRSHQLLDVLVTSCNWGNNML
jgi:hypothetical protein